MNQFIYYPKCSTCIKAKHFLDEKQADYQTRHIKDEPLTSNELKTIYQQSGLPLKRFFNTSGLVYKELKLKDQLKDMDEDEQLSLLASNGMLVKRPILIYNNIVIIGFKEEEYKKLF